MNTEDVYMDVSIACINTVIVQKNQKKKKNI